MIHQEKTCSNRVDQLRSGFLQALLKFPSQSRPYFFLKTGPPGAGKSTVNSILYPKFKINPKHVVSINIDDLVQEFTPFLCACKAKQANSAELRKQLYFRYRAEVNDLLEAKLFAAMALRLHIEFETLGASLDAVKWLLTLLEATKRSHYTTVMVYVSVTKETLTKRLSQRNTSEQRYVDLTFALSVQKQSRKASKTLKKYVDRFLTIDNNTDNEPHFLL